MDYDAIKATFLTNRKANPPTIPVTTTYNGVVVTRGEYYFLMKLDARNDLLSRVKFDELKAAFPTRRAYDRPMAYQNAVQRSLKQMRPLTPMETQRLIHDDMSALRVLCIFTDTPVNSSKAYTRKTPLKPGQIERRGRPRKTVQ